MQIQVGYIATEFARLTNSDHCIEVGTIDIHLTAVIMNDLANFFDALFKHAMSGGISHHNGC